MSTSGEVATARKRPIAEPALKLLKRLRIQRSRQGGEREPCRRDAADRMRRFRQLDGKATAGSGFEAEALEARVDLCPAEPERLGGARLVAPRPRQRLGDDLALPVGERGAVGRASALE